MLYLLTPIVCLSVDYLSCFSSDCPCSRLSAKPTFGCSSELLRVTRDRLAHLDRLCRLVDELHFPEVAEDGDATMDFVSELLCIDPSDAVSLSNVLHQMVSAVGVNGQEGSAVEAQLNWIESEVPACLNAFGVSRDVSGGYRQAG